MSFNSCIFLNSTNNCRELDAPLNGQLIFSTANKHLVFIINS